MISTTDTDAIAPTVSTFDAYQRIAADYQAAVANCQRAIYELRVCEDEFRALGGVCEGGQVLADSTSDFEIEQHLSQLSPRELQVFSLLGHGLSTPQIARQLNVVTSTVETYRERLKSKLNIDTGAALSC